MMVFQNPVDQMFEALKSRTTLSRAKFKLAAGKTLKSFW